MLLVFAYKFEIDWDVKSFTMEINKYNKLSLSSTSLLKEKNPVYCSLTQPVFCLKENIFYDIFRLLPDDLSVGKPRLRGT